MASLGKPISAEDLNKIIDDSFYTEVLDKVKNECEFCNAVYQIMLKINEKREAIQVKAPPKEELETEFKRWRKSGTGKLTKEECRDIIKSIMKPESLSVGRSALQAVMYIFGAPIGAFFAKRFIPGGGRVSDDVLLPVATSLTVLFLVTRRKL